MKDRRTTPPRTRFIVMGDLVFEYVRPLFYDLWRMLEEDGMKVAIWSGRDSRQSVI